MMIPEDTLRPALRYSIGPLSQRDMSGCDTFSHAKSGRILTYNLPLRESTVRGLTSNLGNSSTKTPLRMRSSSRKARYAVELTWDGARRETKRVGRCWGLEAEKGDCGARLRGSRSKGGLAGTG